MQNNEYKIGKMSKLQTDGSTYNLDIESFIEEIKNNPVIWDLNCEDNRHMRKKQAAWERIARKFIIDFDDLPPLEKMDIYRKLHNKWRNIRDSYVRNMKRQEPKRGYVYARHLAFLSDLYTRTFSTDDEAEQDGSEEDSLQAPKKTIDSNSLTWPSDTEDANIDLRVLKRRRIEAVEKDSRNCVEDDDRSFFESLLPAVRSLTLDQKLEFRSDVLRLVKNLRGLARNIKTEPTVVEFD